MTEQDRWGRVAEDGTVYVTTSAGERAVGSWQAGDPAAGLEHFRRRFDTLDTEVELLEQRTRSGAGDAKSLSSSATKLRASLATASAVGDLDGLDARLAAVQDAIRERAETESKARSAAREQAVAAKQRLADEAGELAESTQWKSSGDRLRQIVAEWKKVTGVDKRTDDELWRRVRNARTTFERRRGAHFAQLDQQRKEAATAKEQLVAEAEVLSGSDDWVPTANRLKALMTEWKSAPRGSREAEDELWKRFRAAQDVFFERRSASYAERDDEYRGNLAVKEELLREAEAIDPSRNLEAARAALRDVQERWDAAGRVPRESLTALDARMKAVEDRVRNAVDARWATQPRQAESNPLVTRLRESLDKLERQLQTAQAAGRENDVHRLSSTIDTQRDWLAQAERSLSR